METRTIKAVDIEGGAVEFEKLLRDADSNARNEWEMEFVCSLRAQFHKYNTKTFITQKQLDLLREMAER